MRLQKLVLQNFKGLSNYIFQPNGQSVSVFGENEAGKSTLEDAQCWLLTDSDRFGNSTGYFSLKPIINGETLHAADYSVEGTYTHEGETIILKKVYQEIWTRNRRSSEEELDRHTTNHYINGEKVKKREYEDFVEELMSQEMFLMLSNPKYLAKEMHKDDRRKLLTKMSDDYTVEDVIAGHPKLERYPRILDGSTHERVEDRLNTRRKDLNEQLDDIPGRIDENQNKIEKVEGVEEAKEKVESLKSKKEKIVAKKNEVKSGGRVASLKVERQELQAEYKELENKHNEKVQENLVDQRQKVSDLQDKVDDAESDYRDSKRDYEKEQSQVKQIESVISNLKDEIKEAKDKEPNPASDFGPDVCPMCERASGSHYIKEVLNDFYNFVMDDGTGTIREDDINSFLDIQDFDDVEEHDYEAYLSEFNEEKAEEIKSLNKELDQAKEDLAEAREAEQKAGNNAANMKGKLSQRKEALKKAKMKLKEQKANQPEFSNEEIDQQIEDIDEKISNHRQEKQKQLDQLDEEINKIYEHIESANNIISKAKNNKIYKDRIEELQQQRNEIAGELDEVESDLRVLELYHQAEGEYITSNVNGMFDVVEWKLFKEQMNGGLKPICEAQVDGVPFEDINTAKKIQAGIDIIQTLSEYFEIEAPVFVDNAEGVGVYPDNNLQIISLIYSKGDKKLRVESDLDHHLDTANPGNVDIKTKESKSKKPVTA